MQGLYSFTKSKYELTSIYKRVTPAEREKLSATSRVSKIIRDEQTKPLYDLLNKTLLKLNNKNGVLVNSLMRQRQ